MQNYYYSSQLKRKLVCYDICSDVINITKMEDL
jgi:hypothetical protein